MEALAPNKECDSTMRWESQRVPRACLAHHCATTAPTTGSTTGTRLGVGAPTRLLLVPRCNSRRAPLLPLVHWLQILVALVE